MNRLQCNLVTILLAALLLAVGCSVGPEDGETGSAHVAVLVGDIDVTRINYSITAPDISRPITGALAVSSNGVASGTIRNVPAGTNRTLTLTATDGAGAVLCSGSAPVSVTSNQIAQVQVTLQCASLPGRGSVDATGVFNRWPEIHSVFVSSTTVNSGGSLDVSVSVSDDDNDALTYEWTASAGTFSALSAATTYTAGAAGIQTITITVRDGRGGSASETVSITVAGGGSTTATIAYYECLDLEAGAVVTSMFPGSSGCSDTTSGDMTWAYNGGSSPHARFFWNEQYAGVAFLARAFVEVTATDISGSTFCDHINDPSAGCQASDPYSALGPNRSVIVRTGAGNYFKVGYVSESDTANTVTFEYQQLIP